MSESPVFISAPWSDVLATADSSEYAARAATHLREDAVIWMTTVSSSGLVAPNPLWYLWDGGDKVRFFTMPETARLKNIKANPRVTLNLAGDATGTQVAVFSGTAEIQRHSPLANEYPEFISKYEGWFPHVNQTPEKYAHQYSVPIEVTLDRVRGF
jgi:PPOX class probable F420-dependent enzyme